LPRTAAEIAWRHGLSYDEGASVTHIYHAPGTYEVLVWVADALGDTTWAALDVEITVR
jgi:hypothetical protein